MIEKMIGKVHLNLDYYHNDDQYSDGDEIENKLLEIVQEHAPGDYAEVIDADGTWPILYHLSHIRENILNWYPFSEEDRVLELGAGCGAVTGAMLCKGANVTAIDLSMRRSMINAYRHRENERLQIIVGNMQEILQNNCQQYDYVTLIGVLEYGAMFSNHQKPFNHILQLARTALKTHGKLLVAIENKLGMKYFAGCREDHTGRLFESIEGYPHHDGPYTFGRRELQRLAEEEGFSCRFFYPYPDYKLPMRIYSDEYLPVAGELTRNWQNFDADRVKLFDESRAFDTIIAEGLFPVFSNSFFVEMERGNEI